MFSKQLLALALSVAASEAVYKGFNYGSTLSDGSGISQSAFQTEFQTAKNLVGTSGFTSARLYTMIQGGTTNDPIQAIPAAIAEDTSLLLGLWASGGNIDNEIAALKNAISTYGDSFGKLVVGISVGSEDLYRNSVTGEKNHAGIGENPDVLVNYIKEVRAAISGTSLSGAPIGHVDTWDARTNSTNAAVIDAIDWLGFDGYPYYQVQMSNGIDNAKNLFDDAFQKTQSVAQGKEVWMTESGWPVSGPTWGDAVASIPNAKQYWDQVACPLLGNVNTWWYTLQDAGASPSFGVTSGATDTTPIYDLRCSSSGSSSSSLDPGSLSTDPGSSSADAGSSSTDAGSGATSVASSSAVSSAPAASGTGVASSAGAIPSASSASGFRSSSTAVASTPLTSATSAAGSSGSGSSSGSSGSSSSGSSTSTSPSASPSFNAAPRATSSSIFGAVAAILALAIAV